MSGWPLPKRDLHSDSATAAAAAAAAAAANANRHNCLGLLLSKYDDSEIAFSNWTRNPWKNIDALKRL